MELIELKFVLQLLGREGYRASISKLNKATRAPKDKTCRGLANRGIVAHTREVQKFEIASAGKALLQQDAAQLPISEQHLLVLKACAEKSITPGKVTKVPATERQDIIQDLEAKGFIEVEEYKIKEVWLTNQGCDYLRDEYDRSGSKSLISLDLLQNYLRFLRKGYRTTASEGTGTPGSEAVLTVSTSLEKPSDQEVLQTIQNLDREMGTDNYLPIFHLRQKLQPPLSRDELDQALYRLQRQDKIDMSSLQEGIHYSVEEIEAGILQPIGGSLFFIVVND